jgi:general secretion pathway protein M
MNLRLTPNQSRWLAVGLLILLLAALVAAIAVPTLLLHRHYDMYLDQYSDHLARYRRVAATRTDVEAAIAEVEKRDAKRYYLKAHSQAMAAAELQGIVSRVIENHKGHMISSQIVQQNKEDAKASPATRIALSAQFSAATVPLQTILHDIEVHEPYLFVDQLTVRANQGRQFKPVPGQQPEFSIQLTVYGFMQAGDDKK